MKVAGKTVVQQVYNLNFQIVGSIVEIIGDVCPEWFAPECPHIGSVNLYHGHHAHGPKVQDEAAVRGTFHA